MTAALKLLRWCSAAASAAPAPARTSSSAGATAAASILAEGVSRLVRSRRGLRTKHLGQSRDCNLFVAHVLPVGTFDVGRAADADRTDQDIIHNDWQTAGDQVHVQTFPNQSGVERCELVGGLVGGNA